MYFNHLVDELNQTMVAEYAAVDADRNPIATSVRKLEAESLEFVLQQYSLFSKNISSFLLDAYFVMAYEELSELADELTQNIQEEFGQEAGSHVIPFASGKESRRLPHYVLLRRGLKKGLGIDVARVVPSPATDEFILGIKEVMNDPSPARVAGGAYALESSAVPELRMVYGFARKLFLMRQKPMPGEVKIFFESHIDELEIGHEQRLKKVCEMYITTESEVADFKSGFLTVMAVMDKWWEGLSAEITRNQQHAA